MQKTENTESVWRRDVPAHELPPLARDVETEVCVIGAGIAGLSAAYELGLAGLGVVVLDDKGVAGGETGQSTAHLASAMDDRFVKLEAIRGIL